jgi:hypothetical protein
VPYWALRPVPIRCSGSRASKKIEAEHASCSLGWVAPSFGGTWTQRHPNRGLVSISHMTVWLDSPKPAAPKPSSFWAWWLAFTKTSPLLSRSGRGLDVPVDRRRSGRPVGVRASDVEWGARWLPSRPAVLPPLHPSEVPPPRPSRQLEGAQRNRRDQWRVDRRLRDCGSPYRVERRSSEKDRRAAVLDITANPRVVVGRFHG